MVHRLASIFSLLRQGVTLGVDYGSRSVETLLSVAETVEGSVYEMGSLRVSKGDLEFRLANPPLRVGAFRQVRAVVDGVPVAPDATRFRVGAGTGWRSADVLDPDHPLELRPGVPTEFLLAGVGRPGRGPVHLRLEFESVAIPPLVWCEFSDEPRRGEGR